MAVVPLFDAVQWMNERLRGGGDVAPDAQACYASLALMIALFEDLCRTGVGGFGSIAALRQASSALHDDQHLPPAVSLRLADYAGHWRESFGADGGMLVRWAAGHLAGADDQEAIERFFGTAEQSLADKAFVLLLCAAFVKSHVLGGAKSVTALNDQLVNMAVAAQSIAGVLEALPPPVSSALR